MKNIYEVVNQKILTMLKEGNIPWRKPWKGGAGQLPKNLVTKKPYRGVNIWLLSFSGYASPYWLTFRQARKLKGTIRKGEKATLVIFWKWLDCEVELMKNGVTETKQKKIPLLRYYNVFNLDQCEGIKNPDAGKGKEQVKEFTPIEACEKIVEGFKSKPEIKNVKQQAFYSPMLDYINMPKKGSFNSPEEYYSTLFHELTHSTGHESRLKRDGVMESHFFGDEIYSKEELVAEFGASYLCGIAGIENQTIKNNTAYIQHWLCELKKDDKLIILACAKAQKAADYILEVEVEQVKDDREEAHYQLAA